MKRIIEECSEGFDSSINPYEIVKLRLRGKGSGFKEGPNQLESEDPLNLRISSKYKEKYDYACSEMEYLLKKVYDEYKHFYRYKQKKPHNWDKLLKIKKEETVTRPKAVPENDEYGDEEVSETSSMTFNSQLHASVNQIMSNQSNQAMGMNQFGQQMFPFQN